MAASNKHKIYCCCPTEPICLRFIVGLQQMHQHESHFNTVTQKSVHKQRNGKQIANTILLFLFLLLAEINRIISLSCKKESLSLCQLRQRFTVNKTNHVLHPATPENPSFLQFPASFWSITARLSSTAVFVIAAVIFAAFSCHSPAALWPTASEVVMVRTAVALESVFRLISTFLLLLAVAAIVVIVVVFDAIAVGVMQVVSEEKKETVYFSHAVCAAFRFTLPVGNVSS